MKINHQAMGAIRSWQSLPTVPLVPGDAIAGAFSKAGARTYRDAALLVYHLPYGRTSSRIDPVAVVNEGRGTCSSKHALLAQLAGELRLPVALMLGIYLMNERNTPGVGAVLTRHGLAEIPEAHCYLMYGGQRIDVTRAVDSAAEPIAEFLHEEKIDPAQIGGYKINLHRDFLRNWLRAGRLPGTWSVDELWKVREECIAALTD